MYSIYSPSDNLLADRDDLSEAKRVADNYGAGSSVFRWNQKDGPSKAKKVYMSEVDRPAEHIWMELDDVVSVLEHFLADRGLLLHVVPRDVLPRRVPTHG